MANLNNNHDSIRHVTLPKSLNDFVGNLKALANGNVILKQKDPTMEKQLPENVPKWQLFEFMLRDITKTFYGSRLHRYQGLSIEYSELESVEEGNSLPSTNYKVRLAGVTTAVYRVGLVKIKWSFSKISLEDAMLKMVLYYQEVLNTFDMLQAAGNEVALAEFVKHHESSLAVPSPNLNIANHIPINPGLINLDVEPSIVDMATGSSGSNGKGSLDVTSSDDMDDDANPSKKLKLTNNADTFLPANETFNEPILNEVLFPNIDDEFAEATTGTANGAIDEIENDYSFIFNEFINYPSN